MNSLQRFAGVVGITANLITQLRELEELRERVEESGTGPAIAADRAQKKNAYTAACAVAKSIRKSSICFPELSCADNQRGLFPRPAQVSDGSTGFLYFA